MTNDITTLNGSLRELGELMANNLTEQGVASTYDEGLTTLANKILDIQGIPSTLTLTSDKSILSYHDRDTCTLTATLTGNDVANKTVEFFNGSTSLGTATTNSTGVATKTYTSQGIGDIEIFARVGTLVSKIYEMQDCGYWNPTEKSLATKNTHMLYDENMAEQLPTNAEISFDVHIPSNNNWDYPYIFAPKSLFDANSFPQYGLFFYKRASSVLCNELVNGTTRYSSDKTHPTTTNQYITMKYVKNGTKISVYVDDSLIYTDTVDWIDNYTDYCVSIRKWSGTSTMYIKNVKIKPL